MTERNETIAAVATAPGRGGVAVVRVSGSDAFAVAERLTGRRPEPGRIACRAVCGAERELLDRCVVLSFAHPHSYTGEDVVEFQCHGGAVTPRRILQACFAAGARLARRGEFTARAFLNGRLDLAAAEGVIDLIDARTDRAADDALGRLGGARTRAYRSLYEAALALSATLEHVLDVDESDLPEGFFTTAERQLGDLRRDISRALATARRGRLLREGALVVLAGAPNAGKSSLMNALLDADRAIVSAVPGTTRDFLEESLDIDGWPVRLVDTAGLRDATADAAESEGVRRAEALVARADVVLVLVDCASEDSPCRVTAGSSAASRIVVATKGDLPFRVPAPEGAVRVSAKTGEGLGVLRARLAAILEELAGAASDGEVCASERECAVLMQVLARLEDPSAALVGGDLVLAANAVREAATRLGELTGAVYSNDLLDRMFSRFCVGK